MKVFFILDDTVFYHPQMFDRILSEGNHQWLGVALATKDVLTGYMLKHLFDVGLLPAAKLGFEKYGRLLYSSLLTPLTSRPMTMRDVVKKHKILHFDAPNVNHPEFIDRVRKLEPDVIVSSNSQIFRSELLEIPKIACINRHSALLPSYGGIFPVLQSVAHGESQTGVTIHFMDEGIDTGKILAQEAVPINPGDTLRHLYKQCFDISVELILEALNLLENDLPAQTLNPAPAESYYSFPTKEDWNIFNERGGRFA